MSEALKPSNKSRVVKEPLFYTVPKLFQPRSISWVPILEMEKLTAEKNIINAAEIADLALHDILGYYSKYSIVISDDDISVNSSLYNEYAFLTDLYEGKESRSWEQVAKGFDNDLILKILEHPKEFHLNEYDYVLNIKK